MSVQPLRIHLCTPVTLRGPVDSVEVPSMVARGLLARLAHNPGRTVPYHELSNAIWDESEPRSARSNLRSAAASLRRMLRDVGAPQSRMLRTRRASPGHANGGMALHVERDWIDVFQAERLIESGFTGLQQGCIAEGKRASAELSRIDLSSFGSDLPTSKWFSLEARRVERMAVRSLLLRCKTALLEGNLGEAERHSMALRQIAEADFIGASLLAVCDYLYGRSDLSLEHIATVRGKHRDIGIEPPSYLNDLQLAVLNDNESELLELLKTSVTL